LAVSLRTPTLHLSDKKKLNKLIPIYVPTDGWNVGVRKLTTNLQ
jgi:hypothetical protein